MTFNPFQENTYLVSDENGECVIIDPGCYETHEKEALKAYVESEGLSPIGLLNTHCHIDHVLGNAFVARTWGLGLEMHKDDLTTLKSVSNYCHLYGFDAYELSPEPKKFLEAGDVISFGNTELEVLFVPGHAPGHIAFVNHAEAYVINGDVLFNGSIGRTDLPGGDINVLEKSIREVMYALPDNYTVYCGHGPETTIGQEKRSNAFFRA